MAGIWNRGEVMETNYIKCMTFNVRGLKRKLKRKTIFKQIKREKVNIAAIQETHLEDSDMNMVEKEMGGIIHYSNGTSRSKGLITYFDKSVDEECITLLAKTERMLVSVVKVENEYIYIINVYAPCKENEKRPFLAELTNIINANIPREDFGNVVCLGDFNMVINNSLDIISGEPHPEVITKAFASALNDLGLNDIWRVQHNNKKVFTWSRGSPVIARRLDYIFIGDNLLPFCGNVHVKDLGLSDHRSVAVDLIFSKQRKGPGSYRMNTSLFKDKSYIDLMKSTIKDAEDEYKHLDPQSRWEMIKVSVKEISQQYSRYIQRTRKNKIKENNEKLNKLQNELAETPERTELGKDIEAIKKQLEISLLEDVRGSSIRAGIKWIEQGEKSNKFFLGLEKNRARSNIIHSLKGTDNKSIDKSEDILEEISRFYEQLYHENKCEEHIINQQVMFMNGLDIPQLSSKDQEELDSPITVEEVLAALKNMKNGSAPGLDGIPTEFYKVFWNDIKASLMNCFLYSLEVGHLSVSQKSGVITLLHKGKGLNRDELKNWRPITLTNTDYKILAKTLAFRLQHVIKNIVHGNQLGFIKGRNIATLIRELDDIIEYGKLIRSKQIVLSIDFEKAFDTISNCFVLTMCKSYGIGEVFIRWIQACTAGRRACVKNNGFMSREFEVQRGIRQGCPLSPLLFVLAVELLAINIRQNPNIKGIKLPNVDYHTKIRQYADDTTFLLNDMMDFREVLARIKEFAEFSGLRLNKDKCQAFCPGDCLFYGTEQEEIKFSTRLFVLGVYFSTDEASTDVNENWEPKIQVLEKKLKSWARRDLSIIGKILLVKTFGLSLFIYLMQSIGMPEWVIKRVNTMFFRFIWKKKMTNTRAFEKVKRKIMFNSPEHGGLKMCNLRVLQDAFYLNWVEKLLNTNKEQDEWAKIPLHSYKQVGGKDSFESNVKSKYFKGLNTVKNPFWKRAICTWLDRNTETQDEEHPLYSQILHNNKHITYKGSHIWLPGLIKQGITRVKDICIGERLMTYREFSARFVNLPNAWMQYNVVLNAIPAFYQRQLIYREQPVQTFFQGVPVGNIGRKGFIQLISQIDKPFVVDMWKRKLGVDITEKHWTVSSETTRETRLKTLQWKVIHNIYPTNILLSKMGVRGSRECEWCKTDDVVEHFMAECTMVRSLWQEIENQIAIYTGKRIKLEVSHILFGLVENVDLNKHQLKQANLAILVGKMTVSKYKYGQKRNILDIFNTEASMRGLWKEP